MPSSTSLRVGLAAYLLFLVVPPALKLAGKLPAVRWPWALLGLWGPLALAVVLLVLTLLLRLVKGRPL